MCESAVGLHISVSSIYGDGMYLDCRKVIECIEV
jgi:hypothetical protein